MLRIAFIAPFGLGQKTTVWARTLPLARFLARQGHVVTLLIPPWDTPKDAGKAWVEGGVQVINVALTGGIPATVLRLIHHLDAFRPQIVHIVKPRAHAGLVQWVLWQRRWWQPWGRKPSPRILLDVDDWEQAWAAINHYHPLVARFLAWQEEWGIRHADAITAASHWLVDRVQQYTPQTPVCYLPNGVVEDFGAQRAPRILDFGLKETAPSTLAKIAREEQVLFVGRYVEVRPDWLAEFWCALAQLRPLARLTVFGDPLEAGRRERFQQRMTTLCPTAADKVTWPAYDADLAQTLYAESVCAIFPSQKSPLHEAKSSVRLATTLLRGLPVVASAVGEQAYYGAAGTAHLVPAEASPAEFATEVATVLAAPAMRATLRQQARQRLLDNYHWEKLGAQLEAFYGKVLG